MESSEFFSPPDYQKTWQEKHPSDITSVHTLLDSHKAVVIEGLPGAGKTTLANLLLKQMKEEAQKQAQPFLSAITTPAVQETLNATTTPDRTHTKYTKLPSFDALDKHKGQAVFVIDEISTRGPDPLHVRRWQAYIEDPHTKFLLLTHPDRPTTEQWKRLFPEEEITKYQLR